MPIDNSYEGYLMLDLTLSQFKLGVTISSAVILFLFGIDSFSKEVQRIAGQNIRRFISKWTTNRWLGALLGAGVTAVVQSSSATSVLTAALVNIGVMSFHQSLGVIIGANVGTTLTAQLVAWRLTGIGPFFIVMGFLLTLARIRYSFMGRSLFYFGFVFFSLDLISTAVEPLKTDTHFLALITGAPNVAEFILAGTLFTIIVQSSSVASGIAVILVQQNLITVYQGILLILGANIGTSFTALFASYNMDIFAKRTALSHLLFNLLGVGLALMILPFLTPLLSHINPSDTGQTLANAHLIFNFSAMILFLLLLRPFESLIGKLLPSKLEEVNIAPELLSRRVTTDPLGGILLVRRQCIQLLATISQVHGLLTQVFYQTDRQDLLRSNKLIGYIGFVQEELARYLTKLSTGKLETDQLKTLTELVQLSLAIKEMNALLDALSATVQRHLATRHIFSAPTIEALQSTGQRLQDVYHDFGQFLAEPTPQTLVAVKTSENALNHDIVLQHKRVIERINTGHAPSGNILIEYLSIAQNIREKINSLRKVLSDLEIEPTI